MNRRRAALVVHGGDAFNEAKQWQALLAWCADAKAEPVSLVRGDPAAAVALANGGHVDVVVAVFPDRDGQLEIAEATGTAVVFLRQTHRPRPFSATSQALIAKMLARGGDVDTIATLLDVPAYVVKMVADARRPGRPRQQPADHPWRDPWPETVERRARQGTSEPCRQPGKTF